MTNTTTKLYALTSTQGTAMPETALAAEQHQWPENRRPMIEVAEASGDWDGNLLWADVTDNEVIRDHLFPKVGETAKVWVAVFNNETVEWHSDWSELCGVVAEAPEDDNMVVEMRQVTVVLDGEWDTQEISDKLERLLIPGPKSTIIITDCGPHRIRIIKAMRAWLDHGLKEAKDLTDTMPCVIDGITDDAVYDGLLAEIEAAGATVETA